MGRKKKRAAEVSADHLAGDKRAVKSAKRERKAAREAVKWAHSRFAFAARAVALGVDDVYGGDDSATHEDGDDSVTREDVDRFLKAATRDLKRLKVMIALADDVFDETDEVIELGGLDE